MEYYLTKMACVITPIDKEIIVTQLVKASSKDNAREVVKKAAIEEKGKDITILEIVIFDTLIGE